MEPLNSCLYRCTVIHTRTRPLRHHFAYQMFLFYLDLDELPALHRRLRLLSYNRRNLFHFKDSDHLSFNKEEGIRKQIEAYAKRYLVDLEGGKIFLLTHLRTLGYIFNPVSFYFCFDAQGNPACAVAEVGNTFGELKPFFFQPDSFENNIFTLQTKKYFYVSPFLDADTDFDFRLHIPEEKLQINIDSHKRESGQLLYSSLTGHKIPISDSNLLRYALRFPAITLQVIGAIHWQAFRLYLKGLPFHKKNAHSDLQREVYRASNH
jgi:DUF1365 family protein